MLKAVKGSKVKVSYTGKLENGIVFDSSAGGHLLEFTVGERQVIKGLEDAVIGMSIGNKRSITIDPNNGYGPYRNGFIYEVDKVQLPDNTEFKVGKKISVNNESTTSNLIVEVTDKSVKLDSNHPLAGLILYFDIELIEIETVLN